MPLITIPFDVVVLVALGATSIVASSLALYVMIGRVNRKLPEGEQIPYFFSFSYPYFSKAAKISREYKRFYPNSHLHSVRITLSVLGLVLMVAAGLRMKG